jgi:CheY-like chemotaxis protein
VHMHTLLRVLDHLVPPDPRRPAAPAGRPRHPEHRGGREGRLPQELPPGAGVLHSASVPDTASRLLVVDDNDNTLRSMRRFLRRQGLPADFARSGEEALWRVSVGRYALVLLDSRMGGISGWTTCRLIKTRPYGTGATAPRVVMMARPEGIFDALRVRLSRCDDRLLKPLGKREVLAQVQPLLAEITKAQGERVSGLSSALPASGG